MSESVTPAQTALDVQLTTVSAPVLSKIVVSRALEAEDEFMPYYQSDALGTGMSLIEPPYNPAVLQSLCSENNTLGPCVDAMVANIDGTGYVIEKEGVALGENDAGAKSLTEFFDEVFPGVSFVEVRRKVRRDMEQTGNGYIEVLRNLENKVIFLRYVAARTIRCMRLGEPMVVEKKVMRGGSEVVVPTLVRERRYAQMIGATWIYFREYGSCRHINYDTGVWASDATPVPLNKRGTEIIHLTVNPHYYTPYGLPRWEGAIPSVLGSRRAEEFNLEFFESGGLPPALVTLSGGVMTRAARQSLEDQFNSRTGKKHRIAFLETQATSGTLDKSSNVDVGVHTFGQDREKDGLFQIYDGKSHDRTRRHFRLPPLFVGDIQAQNFAVAYTSYLVAENQVFAPERDIFDDMVNRLLMPAIGGHGYFYRSKSLTLADIQTKLAALQIAGATNHVDPKDIVEAINELAGLNLAITDVPVVEGVPGASPQEPQVNDRTLTAGTEIPGMVKPKVAVHEGRVNPSDLQKSDFGILGLADAALSALRKRDFNQLQKVHEQVGKLDPVARLKFDTALGLKGFATQDPDVGELAACALAGTANRES